MISGPTLFMGLGGFIWILISVAVGRRAVFLLCTAITLLTIISAGLARNFYQLLVAMCFIGLVTGMSTSMVSYQDI